MKKDLTASREQIASSQLENAEVKKQVFLASSKPPCSSKECQTTEASRDDVMSVTSWDEDYAIGHDSNPCNDMLRSRLNKTRNQLTDQMKKTKDLVS